MADNINVTPGSGAVIAAKDQAGVLHQQSLLETLDASGVPVNVSANAPIPTSDGILSDLLRRIIALLMSPRGYDKSQARQRVTAAVESGTITTVTTVTTCSTVSNMNQLAGRDAGTMHINPINRTSWALNHRSRIS